MIARAISSFLFQPPRPSYSSDLKGLRFTDGACGRVALAFIPSRQKPQLTVFYSHGNSEDIGTTYGLLRVYAKTWNVNVVTYDYPGYGLSEGKPSETGVYQSADAAFQYATATFDISADRIILFGRSLGGAPATKLALTNQVGGVVLQSAFLSLYRICLSTRFSFWGDAFKNIDRVSHINAPILVVHGTRDEVIPVHHGRTLHRIAKTAVTPLWILGAGHNDIEVIGGPLYFKHVARFLTYILSEYDEGVGRAVADKDGDAFTQV